MKDITIIIKTFDRYDCLKKLLKSIEKYYNDITILIGDDSSVSCEEKIKKDFKNMNIKVFNLPYDCGLSYGRNYLLNHVKTKYICLCDDDFEFDKNTSLEEALKILKKENLDILGGYVRNYKIINHSKDYFIRFVQKILHYELPTNYIGTIVEEDGILKVNYLIHSFPDFIKTDIVLNFFIAKTESLKKSPWDNELKLQEHTAFFYKAKKNKLKIGFTNKLSIRHCPIQNKNYKIYRQRNYTHVFMEKYNINKIISTFDDKKRNNVLELKKIKDIFISIIVPMYNVEGKIDLLINSLKNQTYKNFEVILVDNNSKDNTFNYVKNLIKNDKRFNIIKELQQGPNFARKKGFDVSKGDYIYFCDSDDYLEDNTLYDFVSCISENNSDVVIGNYIETNCLSGSVKIMNGIKNYHEGNLKDYKDIFLIKLAIWNKIFKRSLINEDTFIFTFIFEDALITLLSMARANKINYINTPVYNYIVDTNGLTSTLTYDKLISLISSQKLVKEKLVKNNYYNVYKDEFDFIFITHTVYRMLRISLMTNKQEKKDAYCKYKAYLKTLDKKNKYFKDSFSYKLAYNVVSNKILFYIACPFIKLLFTNKTINNLFKKLDK